MTLQYFSENHRITLLQMIDTITITDDKNEEDEEDDDPSVIVIWSSDAVLDQISRLPSLNTLIPRITFPGGECSICDCWPTTLDH